MNKVYNPTTIAAPVGAYSHAIEVPAGARTLFISGQVGVIRQTQYAAALILVSGGQQRGNPGLQQRCQPHAGFTFQHGDRRGADARGNLGNQVRAAFKQVAVGAFEGCQ